MRFNIIIVIILIGQTGFAQSVLKLRGGLNYYTAISANPADVFMPLDQSESNGIIQFNSKKVMALYDNIEYPFLLEYEHNQNWSITSGVILNSFAPVNMYYFVPTASSIPDPITGNFIAGSNGGGVTSGVGLTKIPVQFSIAMLRFGSTPERIKENEKAFFIQLDLVVGGSLWFRRGPNNTKFQYDYLTGWQTEDLNGGTYTINAYGYSPNKYSGGISGGINFRFRTKKHEYAKLSLLYEQGLTSVTALRTNYLYTIDNKTYSFNGPYSFTRGSNFLFRLDFPVFTYNFTKKKFYRD